MAESGATHDELIDRCLEVLAARRHPKAVVYLVVSKGRLPRGFPRGEVLCVTQEQEQTGHRSMAFPAMRVLAWALERSAEHQEAPRG